jgi:hypothetical protein
MNLLGTFQPRLVAIPSLVLLFNGPLLAHGYVALTNDMLKAYKVAQV